jgi:hypothetical protein
VAAEEVLDDVLDASVSVTIDSIGATSTEASSFEIQSD